MCLCVCVWVSVCDCASVFVCVCVHLCTTGAMTIGLEDFGDASLIIHPGRIAMTQNMFTIFMRFGAQKVYP